jgi:transposase
MSMNKVIVYVGLDYHQHSVQVCVMDRERNILAGGTRGNSWEEVAAVITGVVPQAQVEAAIESCSGAANLAEELVSRAGWSVSLGHPGYVARMKQTPDKTDWQDAQVLADLVRVGYLPRVWLAPRAVRELRKLVRFRQQLANERRSAKQRIRALLRDERIKSPSDANAWTKAWLGWLQADAELGEHARWVLARHLEQLERLKRELSTVEARLAEVTANDPVVQRLLQSKGVGIVTACTLRAEIGRFDRFRTGKQLARFCGTSPRNASSGQRQADAGLVKASNPELRRVLIETAHRLMLHEERWHALGKELRSRGKAGSVTAAAVANRWIRWLHGQMTTFHLAG